LFVCLSPPAEFSKVRFGSGATTALLNGSAVAAAMVVAAQRHVCCFVCSQLAGEQERDKEAAQIASERYRRERDMQRKEAEEARQRKKQAFLK
jgi:hypothetical protein